MQSVVCLWLVLACCVSVCVFVTAQEKKTTLALVKPDGVAAGHTQAIKDVIDSSGLHILREITSTLDEATAKAFYSEHSSKPFFPALIDFMTSGPVVALVLDHEDAVLKWRALMGPTDPAKARQEQPESIRALFGTNTTINCVHGSDSTESATREISIIFKDNSDGARHDEL